MDFEPGSVIADRFQVLENLGEGALGYVYKVHDTVLDINAAIKILKKGVDSKAIIRFQREAKTSGKLNHPNIATIMDFTQLPDGTSYIVMEFVEGKSLSTLLSNPELLDGETCFNIFIQILEAMNHAHTKKVLHRDLKPSNVIVSFKNEEIKVSLVDFGLAKAIESTGVDQSNTGFLMGSPPYMSPEQLQGKSLDLRTDIYSFGCLMFAVVTGKPPFSGKNALETMNLHISEKVPRIEGLCRFELPKGFQEVLDKCLAKDKEDRYASFSELKEALVGVFERRQEQTEVEEVAGREKKSDSPKVYLKLLVIPVAILSFFILWQQITVVPNDNGEVDVPEKIAGRSDELIQPNLLSNLTKLPKVEVHEGKVTAIDIDDSNMQEVREAIENNKTVFYVCILSSELTGRGIEKIVPMKRIGRMSINSSDLDDSAFKKLSCMAQLWDLDLRGNQNLKLGDIKHIRKGLTSLKKLNLGYTLVNDNWLAEIARMKNLESLNLRSAVGKISIQGIEYLTASPKLEELIVSAEFATPENLNVFLKMKHLTHLKFAQSQNATDPIIVSLYTEKLGERKCFVQFDKIVDYGTWE